MFSLANQKYSLTKSYAYSGYSFFLEGRDLGRKYVVEGSDESSDAI